MIVVSDTSPLNYLILIGQIELLPAMFGTVIVPPAVIKELQHPDTSEIVRAWMASPPEWVQVRSPREVDNSPKLGPGEREAIGLAYELRADYLLIDERRGREVATRRGIPVVGIIGVLARSSERKLVVLDEAIAALTRTSFRVDLRLVERAVREAKRT